MSYKTDWQNRNRQKHRDLGLCVDCNNAALPDLSRCAKHWYEQRNYNKKYYQGVSNIKINKVQARQRKLGEEGKCQSCGRPIEEEGTTTRCYACSCSELRRIR